MKTIFANLATYKDYDKILKEIYGYLEPSYNFEFLIDSLKVLNNLMTNTTGIVDVNGYVNELVQYLEQTNLEKLKNVIDSIFSDIEQRKIPLIQLNKEYNDVVSAIEEALKNYLIVFQSASSTDYTERMKNILAQMKNEFSNISFKYKEIIANYAHFNGNNKMQVRCFSNENFPNGDNRIIDDLRLDVSLLELLLIIEQKYIKSPISLHYVDDFGERVTIDDEKALSRAIEKAVKEHQMKNNLVGPVVFDVIVASPMVKGVRNYVYSDSSSFFAGKMCKQFRCVMPLKILDDIFQGSNRTNLKDKVNLLTDLKQKTKLDRFELEKIYDSFVQVTKQRFQNKADGVVNFQEFTVIMQEFVRDQELISELFNSIDSQRKGEIDFRDFVCAMSILKGGSLEDRLQLAFMAYDIDRNGFIDKGEMFQLLKASATSKGKIVSEVGLWDAVNRVFAIVDKNNDGHMSYTEFKAAVLNNQLLINSFWTDTNLIKMVNNKAW